VSLFVFVFMFVFVFIVVPCASLLHTKIKRPPRAWGSLIVAKPIYRVSPKPEYPARKDEYNNDANKAEAYCAAF